MKTLALPSAFDALDQIDPSRAVIFLDYDGTLTPIVARPSESTLSESMRNDLHNLAAKFPVAVVSGRDLGEIKKLVGLKGVYYAGSHGMDIAGPEGIRKTLSFAETMLPLLKEKQVKIEAFLAEYEGAELERKRFSFAIHYRNVEEKRQEELKKRVEKCGEHPNLKWRYGKKVLELQPAVEWDKGKAVLWLLEHMGVENPYTVYIGDDLTDEDAFKAIGREGMAIVIADDQRETAAAYRLDSVEEVGKFIAKLMEI